MDIHIVQEGDTFETIAEKYGVTVERLFQDNGLTRSSNLVIGQAIIITYPTQIHIVQEGDTLLSIAAAYGVSVIQLLQYNTFLADREHIYPGETLVISYSTKEEVGTHGFLYSHIKRSTLVKTLPLLSFVSVFNYQVSDNYEIIQYGEDSDIPQTSLNYGTVPILMASTTTFNGIPNVELIYEILLNKELQEKLLGDLIEIIKEKGYYGLNILVSGINTTNQYLYIDFFIRYFERLKNEGLYFFISVDLNTPNVDMLTNRMRLDYTTISNYVDSVIFLQYYRGINPGAPKPVNNLRLIESLIKYVSNLIPREKIAIGMSMVGYDWELPYRPNVSRVTSLSTEAILALAYFTNAIIQFDEASQTPFYHYKITDQWETHEHIVWFVDARSMYYLFTLNYVNRIKGSGIWGIMEFNQQLWSILCSNFKIIKYLL